jgi:signal transduction histidine kinase
MPFNLPEKPNASPAGGIDYIEDRGIFEAFVNRFQLVLMAACMVAAIGIVTHDDLRVERLFQVSSFMAVVLLSRWSMRFGVATGVSFLVLSLCALNTLYIYRFAGVHSANLLIYPMVAAFAGWAMGRRWLWAVLGFTIIVVMLLAVGEQLGAYQPKPRAGPLVVAAIVIGVMAGTAFLTNAVFTDFAHSRQRLTDMSRQLALQNERLTEQNAALLLREYEVQHLNQSLELRVQQRTTELQDALAQLRHSQEGLARSERLAALGALVAGVSHELNTPIGNSITAASTINDYAKNLNQQVDGNTLKKSQLKDISNHLKEGSDLVLRNLERAADLIQSFKRVSVDQTSESMRRFNLAQMVHDVVSTLAPSLRHQPQRLTVELPPDILMDGYPGPLGQVVINLVQNAYSHAFEVRQAGGTVHISAWNTRLTDGRDAVSIAVDDNGDGIPEKNLPRLFEPFFTTKMGRGGTGLGLSIVYNIVNDVMGGSIEVRSTVGKGTRFEVTLPLHTQQAS